MSGTNESTNSISSSMLRFLLSFNWRKPWRLTSLSYISALILMLRLRRLFSLEIDERAIISSWWKSSALSSSYFFTTFMALVLFGSRTLNDRGKGRVEWKNAVNLCRWRRLTKAVGFSPNSQHAHTFVKERLVTGSFSLGLCEI